MGMGRFSLTPQIPLFIAGGHLTLSSAGILAAMNDICYLGGAIHVNRLKSSHAHYLRTGLLAAVLVGPLVSSLTGSLHAALLIAVVGWIAGDVMIVSGIGSVRMRASVRKEY